jgi:hypothetical protein
MGKTENPKLNMKTLILLVTAGMLSALPLAAADVEASVVTSTGTVAQYVPGSTFVMTEPTGPVTYAYGPQVTYVTRSGTVIPETELRSRIVAGTPVSVHYVTEGDRRVIRRVVVDSDDIDDDDDDD